MKFGSRMTLPAAAAVVGVLIVGLAAYSPTRAGILDFLQHKTPQAEQADAAQSTRQGGDTMAPADLAAGQAPNYRSIVRQWGPAVVGVTVEGTRKIGGVRTREASLREVSFFKTRVTAI